MGLEIPDSSLTPLIATPLIALISLILHTQIFFSAKTSFMLGPLYAIALSEEER
jgi:hypothetical protein